MLNFVKNDLLKCIHFIKEKNYFFFFRKNYCIFFIFQTNKHTNIQIPFSSANKHFEQLFNQKNRLLVFNKADLANQSSEKYVKKYFSEQHKGIQVEFAVGSKSAKNIKDALVKLLRPTGNRTILICGMPNVGKSTIINSLKQLSVDKRKVAKTGPLPGVTRNLTSFRLTENPPSYIIDSPGIMLPKFSDEDAEIGLKLALTGAIKDSVVGEETIADYLIFQLSQRPNALQISMRQVGVDLSENNENSAADSNFILSLLANRIGAKLPDSRPNIQQAAKFLIQAYREGRLGRFTFDDDFISTLIPKETSTTLNENENETKK